MFFSTLGVMTEFPEEYLKISDVGEEEADEGEGQTPFRHCADNVRRVALKNMMLKCFHLVLTPGKEKKTSLASVFLFFF